MQVRGAENSSDKENKVFVGMLPKTATESTVVMMFGAFGEITEIHMIKGADGQPKGCAFVKFIDRGAASAAIDMMHDTVPEVSVCVCIS